MSRSLGCDSPISAAAKVQRAMSLIAERRGLSAEQIQAVAISLEASLAAGLLSGRDTYKVPAGMELTIFQAHGYLRMPNLNTEPALAATLGTNLIPSERWLVKSQNCLVSLRNQDRKGIRFFEGDQNLVLGSMMPPMGYPLVFPIEAPLMAQDGETIEATFTLQDETAAVVGNESAYGIVLTGCLIKVG